MNSNVSHTQPDVKITLLIDSSYLYMGTSQVFNGVIFLNIIKP